MTEARKLTITEIADRLGITPSTWRTYVWRGTAPPPDGRLAYTPWWRLSTIRAWEKTRPGRGAGGGRPRKETPA